MIEGVRNNIRKQNELKRVGKASKKYGTQIKVKKLNHSIKLAFKT